MLGVTWWLKTKGIYTHHSGGNMSKIYYTRLICRYSSTTCPLEILGKNLFSFSFSMENLLTFLFYGHSSLWLYLHLTCVPLYAQALRCNSQMHSHQDLQPAIKCLCRKSLGWMKEADLGVTTIGIFSGNNCEVAESLRKSEPQIRAIQVPTRLWKAYFNNHISHSILYFPFYSIYIPLIVINIYATLGFVSCSSTYDSQKPSSRHSSFLLLFFCSGHLYSHIWSYDHLLSWSWQCR